MNRLKYWRAIKDMTVRELADKAGVSPTTINRLENDYIKGEARTLAKLAKALEVDLMEFADLIEDPKPGAQEVVNRLSARTNTGIGVPAPFPAHS